MAWVVLVIAGLFETVWAVGLKYTHGFTRLWPSLLVVAALAVSMLLLAWSAKQLPIGTAYAVWVGIGAFGVAVYGMLVLGEPASLARVAFLLLLLGSIIGLKLTAQGG